MVERVTKVLESRFPGIDLQIEEMPNGRIMGTVVREGFADLDQVDRQTNLRDALRDNPNLDGSQIGLILAYTPEELFAMKAA
jgi:hypothetical protein